MGWLGLLKYPEYLIVSATLWLTCRAITLFKFLRQHQRAEREPFQFFVTDIWAGIAALLPSFFVAGIVFRHSPVWPELCWIGLFFIAQTAGIAISAMQLTRACPLDRTDRSHRAAAIVGGGVRGLGGLGIAGFTAMFITPPLLSILR